MNLVLRIGRTMDAALKHASLGICIVGSAVVAVLMFFTTADVVGRYFFSSPIHGDYEISAFMMALIIPSGMALTALREKHIRVDVLTNLLPKRVQAGLSSFAYLILLGCVAFMVWQAATYAHMIRKAGTMASNVPVPHWPFVIVLTIYLVVFALVALRNFVGYIRETVAPGRSPLASPVGGHDGAVVINEVLTDSDESGGTPHVTN